jgi:hypothetical protein
LEARFIVIEENGVWKISEEITDPDL